MDENIFQMPLSYDDDFQDKGEIGRGNFGVVNKVMYYNNGKIYAIKRYQKIKMSPRDHTDYFREKTILYRLALYHNPNIVKLYADFEDITTYYLVMEFVEGKTLKKLCTNTDVYLFENQIINILSQLLKTLQFLHDECHIIHRDIRPENIILQQDNTIKVLDFGISVYLENSNPRLVSQKTLKGELHFVPDEMLTNERNYDYKLDIFSLGFTMYGLMNPSRTSFPNLPQMSYKVEGGFLRVAKNLENENSYPLWLNNLVKTLYDKNPNNRPTAEKALQDLQNYKNNSILIPFTNLNIQDQNSINSIQEMEVSELNPTENINNNIFSGLPILNPMQISAQQLNMVPNPSIIKSNLEMKRLNSFDPNKIIEKNQSIYLNDDMGKNNKIMSSMKSLLQILYQLDIMEDIKDQLYSIIINIKENANQYFINTFHEMVKNIQQFENEEINQELYDKNISDFINQVFFNNKNDTTGTRPPILFYMISSIFKNEFNQYFNFYQNKIFDNVIQNSYISLNKIITMYNKEIFNSVIEHILYFKNNYKGPFVDNFYFLLLRDSKCPKCNNLYGVRIISANFLQLDVKNPENKIPDLINNYFIPKNVDDNCECKMCGLKGKKIRRLYCLNLPNYLILELEDKNSVTFDENIFIPLFDGTICSYQYFSGIYKFKNQDTIDFVAVIKKGENYCFYHDDILDPCENDYINLENPSMVIYKKVS